MQPSMQNKADNNVICLFVNAVARVNKVNSRMLTSMHIVLCGLNLLCRSLEHNFCQDKIFLNETKLKQEFMF